MTDTIQFTLDGEAVRAEPGQTILQAAIAAGRYIPHLCAHQSLVPYGSCRICTVKVDGRPQAACTYPAGAGMVVESATPELLDLRRALTEMLLVEGNHFCPTCEKSGNCELQAMAYRLGILQPRFGGLYPKRELDATHPDLYLDRNRCILCARCVRASRDLDGKQVFGVAGRGPNKHIIVDARTGLSDTEAGPEDRAVELCPVGSLMKKRVGFAVPIGQRRYDHRPIGWEIEARAPGSHAP